MRQKARKTVTRHCGVVTVRGRGVEATPRFKVSYCVVIVTLASQAANTTQTKKAECKMPATVRRPQATAADEPRRGPAVGWVMESAASLPVVPEGPHSSATGARRCRGMDKQWQPGEGANCLTKLPRRQPHGAMLCQAFAPLQRSPKFGNGHNRPGAN